MTLHATHRFREAAGDLMLGALEREPAAVYGLGPGDALAYTNPGWRAFASANGGADVLQRFTLGVSIRAVIPLVLVRFYEEHLRTLEPGDAWDHEYTCSSPTHHRRFRMRTVRLRDRDHLVVANHLVEELPATPEAVDIARFVSPAQLVTQCAHCRRVKEIGGRWAWVPRFVEDTDRLAVLVSHGLCPPCLEYHYPEEVLPMDAGTDPPSG